MTDQDAKIEAAVLRRLIGHLQKRSDVQNIDMMNLSGFCRNCLARWYGEAAAEAGAPLDQDTAQQFIYGMPYAEWKAKHQAKATPEQLAALQKHSES